MRKHLLITASFALLTQGCDSVQSDSAQGNGAAAPISSPTTLGEAGAAGPTRSFDSVESFQAAVEAEKLRFTQPVEGAQAARSETEGFVSLFTAQQGVTEEVETSLRIPDPALASVLNATGDVRIADLTYTFGMEEVVARNPEGSIVSQFEVTASESSQRSMMPYSNECYQYGPIKVYDRKLYQGCGDMWETNWGIYASRGARIDHYRQEKSFWKGWHYADQNAYTISLACSVVGGGDVGPPIYARGVNTLVKYFDSGFFGYGDDTDATISCYVETSGVNPANNTPVYDGRDLLRRYTR